MTEPISVLVVDDDPDLVLVVRGVLEAHGAFRVAGEAHDLETAARLAGELQPELLVLDLHLPDGHGLDALPRIRQAAPRCQVVVLTGLPADSHRDAAFRDGAVGFLEKGLSGGKLVDELLAVAGVLEMAEHTAQAAREFRSAPPAASEARRFVSEAISRWGCRPAFDVIALLVSEVVTNAVRHGQGDIELCVRLLPHAIRIEVADGSPAMPVVRNPDTSEVSGRGMLLVEKLSSAWGVEPLGSGKVTWFELPRLESDLWHQRIE